MNNVTLSMKIQRFERATRDFFEDNPLNIDRVQLASFKHEVIQILIEQNLNEADDNIYIVAQAVAENRGYAWV